MTTDMFRDYRRENFTVGERESFVVFPENALPGKPWVWRTEFFGSFDYADMELLRRGWHLAYHRVSDMFGCPESILMMREFHDFVTEEFGLSEKPVLFGFSRGGMYAVNFAAAYPERVGGLYLDAPVLDMRSWPFGMGKGSGSEHDTEMCLECYHLDRDTVRLGCEASSAAEWQPLAPNPVENAEKLAKASVPVFIVAGDSDTDVPYSENGEIFARRFSKAGGNIGIITKPGCGHHPHSLEQPEPICAFCEHAVGIK